MDQRNMILAFALSMVVLLGWGAMFPEQPAKPVAEQAASVATGDLTPPASDISVPTTDVPAVDVATAPVVAETSVAKPVSNTAAAINPKNFNISNDMMTLTINDQGWFTRASLTNYKESLDADAKHVATLNMGDGHSVYANAGVLGRRIDTPFTSIEKSASSILLQATLDDGRLWKRQVSLSDGSYVIDIKDRIIDGSGMKMYRQVVERHPDREASTFYEHSGPTALLNGKLVEPNYDDLDEKGAERMASIGGWTAIMNRYFIAALITNPEQDYPYYFKGDGRSYQAGLIDDGTVEGKDAVFTAKMFVGPKSIPVLEDAGSELERSVDFGWFAPISQPMHSFLGWLYQYLGNYGWCIIVLVICIKILFFYPTQKSYESMASMRKLQPEMTRLKEQYGDDRQAMGQEVMKLYKKHKVNPLGGCLPIIIQIPVFFALYKVLLMSIEMRQAPFIGWIEDMSLQDPYFVLPVLMGISMFIQQRLNPQPPDPVQAKVMQFLPFLFTALFLFFPAGLVLYWVVNNVLSIIQQRLVMKRMNVD
ncbi:YidC/Oxa1 family membrane protein insertase [Mariprofundus micogutta]|uniref:Membrane protein insertase YidC n=1 Tax=Mariprofundus micogutta TaxID=1921010 RepID=A0A1L8CQ83_9PROT|nr:membrane protein insertase YidC [Mariprofundus micogutta]GAV21043.1 YidC/Oxa1 family membrane protein insertase [Mariprofundus micogutta]